jgi:hypothetical protein
VGRRHEGCGLLVPGHDQLDSGAAQRFDDVEVFFAWNAKDLLDTLILKGGDEQVGAFHGLQSSLGGADEQFSADAILDRVDGSGPANAPKSG